MSVLLVLVALAPLALAAALAVRPLRPPALALAPWAAVPALALAPVGADDHAIPWLLLGARVGLDATGQVFLAFAALLWTAAGVYARRYLAADPHRHRFFAFFLLAMAGNLGLVVARDVVSFYALFAVMTFSAYGLVVHERGAAPRRAGRIYIALAVAGEAMLVAGLVLAVRRAGSLEADAVAAALAAAPDTATMGLLLAGFGIKAGVVPLHVWLPLAHPVAPTPASAVLSGAMIKAGLLGWLRVLPVGRAELDGWAAFCIALGLLTAFFAVAAGLGQRDPKTVLAYSSVSQMGLMLVGLGAGFAAPDAWAPLAAGLAFFALHHGLAKGALFLGTGLVPAAGRARVAVLAGLAFASLALAGAPATSGATAKGVLDASIEAGALAWPEALLPFTSLATALLLGRFLLLVRSGAPAQGGIPAALWAPWAVLVGALALAAWVAPAVLPLADVEPYPLSLGALIAGLWPLGAAAVLLVVATSERVRRLWPARAVPAGDLVVPLEHAWAAAAGALADASGRLAASSSALREARVFRGAPLETAAALERTLVSVRVGGAVLLALALLLVGLLALTGGGP